MVRKNFAILDRLYEAQPKHLQRNTESQVASLELRLEVRLCKGTGGNRRILRGADAAHRPKLMHAAISSAIGVKLESHFTDGAELRFKRRDNVQLAEAMGNEPELRIFRRLRNRISRVRNDEPARAAQDRMGMTQK